MPTAAAGERVSHYLLKERLGTGAAGVVYRARDEHLGRDVALKFLSPTLASDADARRRFVEEARAASALDHPNICTVFDIEDPGDGELFLAMTFYRGETLDRIIARGAIPVEKVIDFGIQTARGLAAAHEEMIIHRDIKPGNLMITDRGMVKILDFGLAKLTRRAAVTNPGTILGTPGYMSPEQIRSEPVDHRTDIWSLGVVLYEMAVGTRPFRGERLDSVIFSILNDEPEPLTVASPGSPRKLERVISRSLAKSPRARYGRMEELLDELQELKADLDSGGLTVRRSGERRARSIAVLPFVDMSPGADQQYFCDGIAEELLGALGRLPDLHVASRTSSFQFRGCAMDIREIGRTLDVETVLEGSVRKSGDRIRIAAQLISVADGYRLWYERYDRELEDIFTIQDQIAQNIVQALELRLAANFAAPGAAATTTDPEAYDLYLQGRQFFHQHRRKGLELARQAFLQSIGIDPGFARAWAGLANCSSFLFLDFGKGKEAIDEAEEASRRALELDPKIPETQLARGVALFMERRFEEAENRLGEAIAIDPSFYDAHYLAGRICFVQGKIDEASVHFRTACSIDPESPDAWYLLGMACRRLGEADRARSADLECVEAAKKRVRQHPEDTRAITIAAAVFAELGEPERAEEWVRRALAIDPDEPIVVYNAACVYIALGRLEEAIGCLETSVGQGGLNRGWLENDPDLDPVRDHPRFLALLQRVG